MIQISWNRCSSAAAASAASALPEHRRLTVARRHRFQLLRLQQLGLARPADAASVASLLITTEAMIADKPEPKGNAGGGGGMGGMGGMDGMM